MKYNRFTRAAVSLEKVISFFWTFKKFCIIELNLDFLYITSTFDANLNCHLKYEKLRVHYHLVNKNKVN